MRCTLVALAVIIGVVPAACAGGTADEGTNSQFIGPDLNQTGWEGLMEYWTYKDGALIGATPKGLKFNTFLCSRKKYGDFELSCEVRLKDGKGNSGVQIRSKLYNRDTFAVHGPQVDAAPGYWGSLFGEHFGGKGLDHKMLKAADPAIVSQLAKNKDFNRYDIKCVGQHVTIKLNGETTVDEDFPNLPREGIIAFQLHAGGPMEVTFRNMHFKELAAGKAAEKLPTPKEVSGRR
jgi:3-keto-disaccharide hydrolase